MEIRRTDLSEPEVRALIEFHSRGMLDESPPGTSHALDLSGLMTPDIEVFAAWEGKRILAIGALKRHDGFGELKSMRAHPDALGKGVGKAMLQHLIDRARDHGFAEVKLETGTGPAFEAAVGLYMSFGFRPCSAFAQYQPGEFNKLYALEI